MDCLLCGKPIPTSSDGGQKNYCSVKCALMAVRKFSKQESVPEPEEDGNKRISQATAPKIENPDHKAKRIHEVEESPQETPLIVIPNHEVIQASTCKTLSPNPEVEKSGEVIQAVECQNLSSSPEVVQESACKIVSPNNEAEKIHEVEESAQEVLQATASKIVTPDHEVEDSGEVFHAIECKILSLDPIAERIEIDDVLQAKCVEL